MSTALENLTKPYSGEILTGMNVRFLPSRSWRRLVLPAVLASCFLAFGARSSSAAELTGFISGAKPGELWGSGVGGAFGITLFNLVGLEFEGAWQGGQTAASDMWSASGRVYVGPTFQRFVPYVGISTGLYRQSLRSASDTGAARGVFVGLKFKLPVGLIVKAEYQRIHLPDDALIPVDGKYLLGAGLSF
jgi:Outer membrane protein beta-barrel domain